jgi:probable poly-beta-1,6-N-acetyl-D-glucosamine export protein
MTLIKPLYFSEINYLRGFAILSVISIHVSTYYTQMETINLLTTLYITIDTLSLFAVPAFIFISGFVLYNNYSIKFKIKQYFFRRFKSIVPQYIIFSTFYMMIASVYGSKISGKSLNLGISDILNRYFTGEAAYHLWFFILIIQLYILYPLILIIYNYLKAKNKVSLFLIATFVLGILFSSYDVLELRNKAPLFVGYLFYFVIGMFTRSNYEFIRLKFFLSKYIFWMCIILIVGTLLINVDVANAHFSLNLFNFDSIFAQIWKILLSTISVLYFTVIITFILYISIYLSKSESLSFIDKIGSYSFAIYLLHAFFIYLVVLIFSNLHFNWNNLLFYPFVFILMHISNPGTLVPLCYTKRSFC